MGVVAIHPVAALPPARVVRVAAVGDHRPAVAATGRLVVRLLAAAGGPRQARLPGTGPLLVRRPGLRGTDHLPAVAMAPPRGLPAVAMARPGHLRAAAMLHPARLRAAAMVRLERRLAAATSRPARLPAAAMFLPARLPAEVCRPDTCPLGCHPVERLDMGRPVVRRLAVYRLVHHLAAATVHLEAEGMGRRAPSHRPAAASARPATGLPEGSGRPAAPHPVGVGLPAASARLACRRRRAERRAPGRRWRR